MEQPIADCGDLGGTQNEVPGADEQDSGGASAEVEPPSCQQPAGQQPSESPGRQPGESRRRLTEIQVFFAFLSNTVFTTDGPVFPSAAFLSAAV